MKKVWIRLGGYISADNETMAAIVNGDSNAIVKAIKENGFELNGETYIPLNDAESVIQGFEIESMTLTVK